MSAAVALQIATILGLLVLAVVIWMVCMPILLNIDIVEYNRESIIKIMEFLEKLFDSGVVAY